MIVRDYIRETTIEGNTNVLNRFALIWRIVSRNSSDTLFQSFVNHLIQCPLNLSNQFFAEKRKSQPKAKILTIQHFISMNKILRGLKNSNSHTIALVIDSDVADSSRLYCMTSN